jgi:uncharacterized small protein (DUF1192 family)
MTEIERIQVHMAHKFAPTDPLRVRVAVLEDEVAMLRHRIMVLEFEITARSAANAALNELLRDEREGVRDHPGCIVRVNE